MKRMHAAIVMGISKAVRPDIGVVGRLLYCRILVMGRSTMIGRPRIIWKRLPRNITKCGWPLLLFEKAGSLKIGLNCLTSVLICR